MSTRLITPAFVAIVAAAAAAQLPAVCGYEDSLTSEHTQRLQPTEPASGRFVVTDQGYMVPYTATIPGTDVTFKMIPIPGGTFMPRQREKNGTESRTRPVVIRPCWIGKFEVTWAEYVHYMALDDVFRVVQRANRTKPAVPNEVDAVTSPTAIYLPEMRYEFANSNRAPAVSMTQFAARQYTLWLSIISGRRYRLPTSAEWEYACRAGSDTRWSCGNDTNQLKDYAVFGDVELDHGPADVGSKKPNRWGLHDMHGNLAEWVMDEPVDGSLPSSRLAEAASQQAEYRWTVAGGSWVDPAEKCMASSRRYSSRDWWNQDADLPFSPWWLADDDACMTVGFRILSPLHEDASTVAQPRSAPDRPGLLTDVLDRIQGGRGKCGVVTKDTPKLLKQLVSDGKARIEQPWKPRPRR